MPKLPSFEDLGERPTPQPASGVVSYRGTHGNETAPGLAVAAMGQDIRRASDELYQAVKIEEERINTQRAEDAFNQLRAAQFDLTLGEQNGFKNKRGADAITGKLMPDYEKRFDDAAARIASTLGNAAQRDLFMRRAEKVLRPAFQEELIRHIAGETDTYAKAVFASTKATELANIAANYDKPMVVGFSLQRVNAAIDREADRLGLSDLKEQDKRAFVDQAWVARLDAWRMADPLAALSAFQQNAEQMSAPVRQRVAEQLFRDAAPVLASQMMLSGELRTVAANEDEAKAMALLARSMGKNLSITTDPKAKRETVFDLLPGDQKIRVLEMAKTQLDQRSSLEKEKASRLLRDAEAAAQDGIQMAIPEEQLAVFGQNSPAVIQRYRDSQSLALNISRLRSLPVTERIALLDSETPKIGAPGYAEADRRAKILGQAIIDVNRRQAEDPAAFSILSAPETAGAAFRSLERALTQPEMSAEARQAAAKAFAAATTAEQQRLGLLSRDNGSAAPRIAILPRPMASMIVQQFHDQSKGPQGPTQFLQAQESLWGPYWPQVYQQVAKELGPTARVVANLRDTPAAALLSMNAGMKTEELRKPLGSGKANEVDDFVMVELEPLRESLVGWTTGGSSTFNDYLDAAKRNAYVYQAQGAEPVAAARRAVDELVFEQYTFHQTTRIPTTVDAQMASLGMRRILQNADTLKPRIPEAEAKMLGPDFTGKQLAAALKNKGFFVTLGDDSGVALFMEGNNGARAVEGADGRPITFTWKQLIDSALMAQTGQPIGFEETPAGAVTGIKRQRGAPQSGD